MVSKLQPITYSCDLHAELLRLWNREYPTVLPYAQLADLEQYLKGLKDARHFLYGDAGRVLA